MPYYLDSGAPVLYYRSVIMFSFYRNAAEWLAPFPCSKAKWFPLQLHVEQNYLEQTGTFLEAVQHIR